MVKDLTKSGLDHRERLSLSCFWFIEHATVRTAALLAIAFWSFCCFL